MTTYTGNCNQGVDKGLYETACNPIQRLQQWFEIQQLKMAVRQERQQLQGLSNRLLKDLGITREQAISEARRIDLPGVRLETILDKHR